MIGLAQIVVLGLAGHRLWRIAAVDDMPLLERLRAWVVGESVVSRADQPLGEIKHYSRPKLRKLIECPWCLGTYLTVALVACYACWPWGARYVIGALAVGEVIGLVGRNLDPVDPEV